MQKKFSRQKLSTDIDRTLLSTAWLHKLIGLFPIDPAALRYMDTLLRMNRCQNSACFMDTVQRMRKKLWHLRVQFWVLSVPKSPNLCRSVLNSTEDRDTGTIFCNRLDYINDPTSLQARRLVAAIGHKKYVL